jgi:hypothetical protein
VEAVWKLEISQQRKNLIFSKGPKRDEHCACGGDDGAFVEDSCAEIFSQRVFTQPRWKTDISSTLRCVA